jgi:RimJ/RimL family protein N-acetyltransferase
MLETERLLLREFTLDDAESFLLLCSHPEVARYTGDNGMTTVDEARAALTAGPLADYCQHGFGRWACVLKSSGNVIGFAGLKYLDDLREVDIGYRFLPAHWGVGLASESARTALADGFERFHLRRVIGLVLPENIASVHVLEKLGLRFSTTIQYRSFHVAKYVIDPPAPDQ